MKKILVATLLIAGSFSAPAFAQDQAALEKARELDACNGFEVLTARFEPVNQLVVSCGDALAALPGGAGAGAAAGAAAAGATATNVVPLVGALGPALGLGAAAVGAAAIAGGGSTSDTQ
ncbi:hypothetical protein [Oceaniglobus ichthyenteri]|uniref:hypothetical protein n=1 Tax=Oceaniglobus ichthyenteri TaxID=2136177 RepID=UPI0013DE02DA|nr:hypothetical protein [Oceaniglobus ichthyenteri]